MTTITDTKQLKKYVTHLEEPPAARTLFGDLRLGWIWLVLRLYVGYEWVMAGWGKLFNPAWTGNKAGAAISGFTQGALAKTVGDHPDVQGFYAWFLHHVVLPNSVFWSYLIVAGEILVGIGLVLGVFTGIAAFFGAFMNMNYLLAGTVSINPVLIIISIFLILAWRTAGWWGLDRWILPALGTPWRPGLVFANRGRQDFEGETQPVGMD
jgi:thiosulfate dehydrogenase [quinone] large subunit